MHLKLAQAGDEKEQTEGNYRRLNHPVSVPVKKGAEADQSWDEMEKNAGIHVYERRLFIAHRSEHFINRTYCTVL